MNLIKPISIEQISVSKKLDTIVFLDIDGVIRTEYGDNNNYDDIPVSVFDRLFCKKAISVLNEVHHYIKYEIVIISTWRSFHTLDALIQIFKLNGVSADVVGVTGVDFNRGLEISNWITSYHPKNWIVIDDNIKDISSHIDNSRIINPPAKTGISNTEYVTQIIDLLC